MRFLPRFLLVAGSVVAVACQQNTVANPALPLEAPASISSISLDSAIFLDWADNAFLNDPTRFSNYRIYSTSYDLDHGVCGTTWAVEGTTVSHVFLAAELANGEKHVRSEEHTSELQSRGQLLCRLHLEKKKTT